MIPSAQSTSGVSETEKKTCEGWSSILGLAAKGLFRSALTLSFWMIASNSPAQVTSSTNESLANTSTAGDQYNYWWSVRTVAVQPDGGQIVVWIDANGLDGSGYGIYGQRFDSSGAKVGIPFQVNTTTAGDQNSPSIAVAPDGTFMVAWDDGQDVYGQRFAQNASRIGSETRLNTSVTSNQKYAELAYYPDGNLLVGYVDGNQTVLQRYDKDLRILGPEVRVSGAGVDAVIDSLVIRHDGNAVLAWTAGGDVYAQVFGPTLQSLTAATRLNQFISGTQEYVVVGADAAGNMVFTWDSDGQDGSGSGAYCRLFDGGLAPRGNEFSVASSTAGDQIEPQVAVDPNGRFVVAWSDSNNRDGGGTAGTAAGYSVWMRLFNADGSPQGAEVQVNQSADGGQGYPIIGMNSSGRFAISWQGKGTLPGHIDSQGVFIRSYQLAASGTTAIAASPSTVVAGDLVTVTMTLTAPTPTSNVSPNPLAVFGANGVFATYVSGPTPASATVGTNPVAFSWTYRVTAGLTGGQLHFGGNAHSDSGLIFPYVDSSAAKITVNTATPVDIFASSTNETLANTATAGDQYNYWWSVRTVAVQPNGGQIVIWIDANGLDGSGYGIFGQRFDSSGAKVGPVFQVNTTASGDQNSPSIAVAPDGTFMVAWDNGQDVFGQRFAQDASRLGPETRLNTTLNGNQKYAELAYYPDGNLLVGYVDGNQTVLQRYDRELRALGAEVRVSGAGVDAVIDSLAIRHDGSAVLAWTSGGDVYAQVFSPTLQAVTSSRMLNQYTAGTQQFAVVDSDGEGNLFFVWESDGQDGSGKGAYGRRFDAGLNAITNEFAVTTNTTGDQLEPQLAVDPSGWYVIAWSDTNNRDGGGSPGTTTGWSVWMRVFDSAGYPVGPEMMVNQSTSGGQGYPIIGMNELGRFAISWQGNGTQSGQTDSQGVFVRSYQFGTSGTTATATSPSTATAGDLVTVTMTLTAPLPTPDVSPNPLAVYGTNGVFATLVSGPTPASATVGTSPVSFTWTYRVTADVLGGQLYFGGNAHSNGGLIFPYADSSAAKITVNPTAAGDIFASNTNEILVNSATAGDQYNYWWSVRTVAVQPDGSQIVVWIDANGLDGSGSGIFGQRFNASGAKVGPAFQVNTITSGEQNSPSISVAPDGTFIVCWDGPGSGTDVYAQRFATDGSKIGTEFLLNTSVSGGQQYPELAYYPDGSFVAGFVDGGQTVLQRFDAQCRFVGQETRISGASNVVMDGMAVRPDKSLVVAWTAGGDVYAQLFGPTLQPITSARMINQFTTGTQQYVVVDTDGEGNLFFVWESDGQDGSGKGAYARRFDSGLNAITNEFLVTKNTAGDQLEPQLAVDPSGWYVVTWTDTNNRDGGGSAGSTTGWSVWMRIFDSLGYAVGPEMLVNQSTAGGQGYPIIGMNDSGRFAVSWQGNGNQPGQVDSQGVFYRTYQLAASGSTTVSASPAMVTAGDLVTVTMTVTSPFLTPFVEPNPLGIFGTNGVFATLVSGPTPASSAVSTAPVSYTWTYRVTADSYSGELHFGGNATSDAGTIFPYADSSAFKVAVIPAFYVSDLTAPNLVGDSNVSSQPDQGPRVFTIGAKVTNPSLNTLTDVKLHLGDGSTPGVFPTTTMTLALTGNTYQGTFSLSPLAGAADCSRDLVTLGAAQPVINGGIDFNRDGVVNSSDDGVLSNDKTVVDGRVDVNLSGTVNTSDDLPRPPGVFYGYRDPAIIDGQVDINGDGVINGADDGTYGGETRNIYWQVAYQTTDAFGEPTWGNAQDIGDDLRYYWNVWGSANDGGIRRTADYSELAKVRNEISANANKISPNSVGYITGGPPRILAGKVDINSDGAITTADDGPYFGMNVIDGLVDVDNNGSTTTADDGFVTSFPVIDGFVDFNRDGTINASDNGIAVQVGQTFTVTVHNADFGTIGQGFDENRDGLWDYDFWHQPIGETDWPASSFRLVDIQSDITGTGGSNPLNGTTNHYDNEPYLSRLIDDRLNQSGGFTGTYSYTFQVMGAGTGFVSMYQEAASGSNNEKYNGDYGTGVWVSTGGTALAINKSGSPDPVQVGGNITWTVGYQNTSNFNVGQPGSGNGVVIEDFIPENTTFVANSAASPTYAATVSYSTDHGATWSTTQPPAASVTRLRWHIEVPLPPGASGQVSFLTNVNSGTPNFSDLVNTAEIKIGSGDVLGRATARVRVGGQSPAAIEGTVRVDLDHDGSADAALAGVAVTLFSDPNGDGNPGDGSAVASSVTESAGFYSFGNLLAGAYVVVETDLPGYLSRSDGDATPDSAGSPADAANVSLLDNRLPVNLADGETDTANDFTDWQYAVVAGHLYLDANGNGIQDSGEPDLAGVDVLITDARGVTSRLTSDAGGDWSIQVPQGTTVADVDEADPDYPSGSTQTEGNDPTSTTALAGITVNGGNDGYFRPGTVAGTVWEDSDDDLTGDAPIPGVTLSLVDGSGSPVLDQGGQPRTTVSSGSGAYAFGGLPPGTYGVVETQPYGFLSVCDKDGGNPDEIRPIELAAGATSDGNDFVERRDRCPDDWDEWKFQHPGETAAGNPDADRYDNFAEFAFAMPYDSGTGSKWLGHTAWIIRPSTLAPGTIEAVFIRPTGAPKNVTYRLQYAAAAGNPTIWQSLVIDPSNASAVNNGDCTETVTVHGLEGLTGLNGSGLVRIEATLDDDGGPGDTPDGDIDHVSHTEPEGWMRTQFNPCCQTFGTPYLRESLFTGTVTAVNGQELAFAPADNLAGLLPTGVPCFIEVTSGPHEGQRFDVVAAAGNSLMLAADADLHAASGPFNTMSGTPPTDLIGASVAVRRHWRLAEVFATDGLVAGNSHVVADQVQTHAEGAWTTYWLYDEGDANPATARWVMTGDSTMSDQGGVVLPPGYGTYVIKRNAVSELLAYGEVRTNRFVRPLRAGAASNLVAAGYPLNQAIRGTASRAMNPGPSGAGFFGSRDFKKADSFFTWRGDTEPGANGYDSYFLLDGSPNQPAIVRWVKVGDASITARDAEILFLHQRAVFVRSASGFDAYSVPTPWTP